MAGRMVLAGARTAASLRGSCATGQHIMVPARLPLSSTGYSSAAKRLTGHVSFAPSSSSSVRVTFGVVDALRHRTHTLWPMMTTRPLSMCTPLFSTTAASDGGGEGEGDNGGGDACGSGQELVKKKRVDGLSEESKVEQALRAAKSKGKEYNKSSPATTQVKEQQQQQSNPTMANVAPSSAASANTTTTTAVDTQAAAAAAAAAAADLPLSQAILTRVWWAALPGKIIHELKHLRDGFILLWTDIKVSTKLLFKTLNGKQLTRRERNLFIRTLGDLFRVVPFSAFIIVPGAELLLPVAIRFFPNMLPSQFQNPKTNAEATAAALKVKISMAQFLQETVEEMAVKSSTPKSADAKTMSDFSNFINEVC
eukprot:UC1_evm1s1226